MRLVLVLLTSVMLSLPAFATITPPGNPDLCEQNPGNPHCHEEGGNGGNGGEGGNSTVNIDISGTLDVNNSNTNTLDNSNTTTIGDTTATGGDATAFGGNASVGDVTGGSINIYGGEDGESGAFSNTNTVDNTSTSTSTATTGDNTNFNTNFSQGGDGGEGGTAYGGNVYIGGGEEGEGGSTLSPTSESDSSVVVGDTTLNNDSTSSAFNGGNTLIVGGQGGECFEGECEGGSGTLNSNAENNVDIDNSSSATGGSVEEGAVVVNNNVTVEGGSDVPTANSQTVEGDETEINVDARTINEAARMPVNSAAPSFSGICNSGAAGSGSKISLSFAVTNDVCQALMVADAYMAMGDVEEAHKWVRAAARHAKWKGGVGYIRHLVTLGIL